MRSVHLGISAFIALTLSATILASTLAHAAPKKTPLRPAAILCAKAHEPPRTIPVPPGKNLSDLCPESAIRKVFYDIRPGVTYYMPVISGAAAPANESGTTAPSFRIIENSAGSKNLAHNRNPSTTKNLPLNKTPHPKSPPPGTTGVPP